MLWMTSIFGTHGQDNGHSLTHLLTHSFTHPHTHSLTHTPSHSLTHSLTHTPTHSLTHSPIHPVTHSFTHPHTHSLTHPLRRSLYRVDIKVRHISTFSVWLAILISIEEHVRTVKPARQAVAEGHNTSISNVHCLHSQQQQCLQIRVYAVATKRSQASENIFNITGLFRCDSWLNACNRRTKWRMELRKT
jgi:hypothetical protein